MLYKRISININAVILLLSSSLKANSFTIVDILMCNVNKPTNIVRNNINDFSIIYSLFLI